MCQSLKNMGAILISEMKVEMKMCVHLFMEAQELAVTYSTMQDTIHMDIVSLQKEKNSCTL